MLIIYHDKRISKFWSCYFECRLPKPAGLSRNTKVLGFFFQYIQQYKDDVDNTYYLSILLIQRICIYSTRSSQNVLGWDGPLRSSSSNPYPRLPQALSSLALDIQGWSIPRFSGQPAPVSPSQGRISCQYLTYPYSLSVWSHHPLPCHHLPI